MPLNHRCLHSPSKLGLVSYSEEEEDDDDMVLLGSFVGLEEVKKKKEKKKKEKPNIQNQHGLFMAIDIIFSVM